MGRRSALLRAAAAGLALVAAGTFSLARSASGQEPLSTVADIQSQTDCTIETPDHYCAPGNTREDYMNWFDYQTDPVVSPVSGAAESGPPNVCVSDVTQTRSASESYAIACAGSGGGGDGRTYYKGNGPPNYECEYQEKWVASTNHRYPKAVYNSMRVCRPGMEVWIACGEKGERVGGDRACTYPSIEWRNAGELMSMSFSARYRKFYCTNDRTAGHVRCAYDWVR